jgi:AraC-like DNA-binding protein
MATTVETGRRVPEHFLIEPHEHPVSITAMAVSLGFSSSQHFARVFRQLTGTTPTTYRTAHRC